MLMWPAAVHLGARVPGADARAGRRPRLIPACTPSRSAAYAVALAATRAREPVTARLDRDVAARPARRSSSRASLVWLVLAARAYLRPTDPVARSPQPVGRARRRDQRDRSAWCCSRCRSSCSGTSLVPGELDRAHRAAAADRARHRHPARPPVRHRGRPQPDARLRRADAGGDRACTSSRPSCSARPIGPGHGYVVELLAIGLAALVALPAARRAPAVGQPADVRPARRAAAGDAAPRARGSSGPPIPDRAFPAIAETVADALRLPYVVVEVDRRGRREPGRRGARHAGRRRPGDRPRPRGGAGRPPGPRRSERRARLPRRRARAPPRPRAPGRRGDPRAAAARRTRPVARAARRRSRGGAAAPAPRPPRRARARRSRPSGCAPRRRRRCSTTTPRRPDASSRRWAPRSARRSPTSGGSSTGCGHRRSTSWASPARSASRRPGSTGAPDGADAGAAAIHVECEPVPLPELPAAVEVAAYRIAVEAMTNAVRHAGASACRVRLEAGSQLTVEVTDDGRGVPDDAARRDRPGVHARARGRGRWRGRGRAPTRGRHARLRAAADRTSDGVTDAGLDDPRPDRRRPRRVPRRPARAARDGRRRRGRRRGRDGRRRGRGGSTVAARRRADGRQHARASTASRRRAGSSTARRTSPSSC